MYGDTGTLKYPICRCLEMVGALKVTMNVFVFFSAARVVFDCDVADV